MSAILEKMLMFKGQIVAVVLILLGALVCDHIIFGVQSTQTAETREAKAFEKETTIDGQFCGLTEYNGDLLICLKYYNFKKTDITRWFKSDIKKAKAQLNFGSSGKCVPVIENRVCQPPFPGVGAGSLGGPTATGKLYLYQ